MKAFSSRITGYDIETATQGKKKLRMFVLQEEITSIPGPVKFLTSKRDLSLLS